MRSTRTITVIAAHAEGEVGRVVTGGVLPPPGATPAGQHRWLMEQGEPLRRFLLNEPRGGVFCHVNLLLPPVDPRADAAFIVMEPDGWPRMSGSNAMCVATVLLETGMVAMREPVTTLILETPAGLVPVTADCEAGRCTRVTIENVPSYVLARDVPLAVPGRGQLRCDLAFGGATFALVDAATLGLRLAPSEARQLVELGERLRACASATTGTAVDFAGFVTPPLAGPDGTLTATHAIIVPPGKIDRSPCGTGTSARMAVLHAQDLLAAGQPFTARSILGTGFACTIARTTEVEGRPAIVPRLTGRAWITAIHQELLDPDDPFPEGYRLADTWPGA